MPFRIIVGGFDLQDRRPSIWQFDKKINIGQHEWVKGMLEHPLDFVDWQAGHLRKDFGHQLLQEVAYSKRNPIAFILIYCNKVQFVIVDIPCRPEWRDPHNCRGITAANTMPPVRQPFFPCEVRGVDEYFGRIVQRQYFQSTRLLSLERVLNARLICSPFQRGVFTISFLLCFLLRCW